MEIKFKWHGSFGNEEFESSFHFPMNDYEECDIDDLLDEVTAQVQEEFAEIFFPVVDYEDLAERFKEILKDN